VARHPRVGEPGGYPAKKLMNVRAHTLPNGCKILIRPTPDKQILSLVAYVDWGGRDDPAAQAGRTNLMARLLTKGAAGRTAVQIAETMESVGGSIDAFCSYDHLGIETQAVRDDWPVALELLSDCLFRPAFDPLEFEKERAIVLSEILRDNDQKFPYTYKAFHRLFYRGHPYALPPEGEIETLKGLDQAALSVLHAAAIRPERVLLTAVGNLPEEEFLAEVEKRWPVRGESLMGQGPSYGLSGEPANRPTGELANRRTGEPANLAQAEPGAGRGETLELPRNFEQGFVIVGYPAPLPGAPDAAGLRMACGILGEGMSSRLFSRLRDRDHLAYSVGASISPRALASHVILYIGTSRDTVDQAHASLLREARGIVEEAPEKEEIQRARQYILGKYLVGRQTNSALAHSMSVNEILGLGWEWGETFPERIEAVTAKDIREAAETYLQNPATAILRPA
jgi:zinc protease